MPDLKRWLGTDGTNPTKFDVAANWYASGVPVDGDSVFLERSAISIADGLAMSAIDLAVFRMASTYTGSIGVAGVPGSYLQIASSIFDIDASGTGLVKLNIGSATAANFTVRGTGSTTEASYEPVRLLGNNSSHKLYVVGGTVGVATTAPSETSTFGVITVDGGTCNTGPGVTLTTLNVYDGTANIRHAVTTCNVAGGTLNTEGTGAITTVDLSGGDGNLNSTGTVGTLIVRDGATADLNASRVPRTFTTIKLYKGATIRGGSHLTVTTFELVKCRIEDVTIEWEGALTITVS